MSVPTYAYAANNPLRYTDPTGLWTLGFGLQASGTGLFSSAGVNGGVYFGYSGEEGFSFGLLGGGQLGIGFPPNASAGAFVQVTNANNVCQLKGTGNQAGASAGEGISGGLDILGGHDGAGGFSYEGGEVSVGVGASMLPAEVHSVGTYTGGWTW